MSASSSAGVSGKALAAVLAAASVASACGIPTVSVAGGIAVPLVGLGAAFLALDVAEVRDACFKWAFVIVVIGYLSVPLGALLLDWRVQAFLALALLVFLVVAVGRAMAAQKPVPAKTRHKLLVARRAALASHLEIDEASHAAPKRNAGDDLGLFGGDDDHA